MLRPSTYANFVFNLIEEPLAPKLFCLTLLEDFGLRLWAWLFFILISGFAAFSIRYMYISSTFLISTSASLIFFSGRRLEFRLFGNHGYLSRSLSIWVLVVLLTEFAEWPLFRWERSLLVCPPRPCGLALIPFHSTMKSLRKIKINSPLMFTPNAILNIKKKCFVLELILFCETKRDETRRNITKLKE